MFDDELKLYRAMTNDELLERVKHNDMKAVAILFERLMEAT